MKVYNILYFVIGMVISCHSQSPEDDIVLINVEYYGRDTVATQLDIINAFNPKVTSLDISFKEYTGSSEDKHLFNALNTGNKIVMASEIVYHGKDYYGKEIIYVFSGSAIEFRPWKPGCGRTGFVSAIQHENENYIPDQFIVFQETFSEDLFYHFSVETAMAFDSLRAVNFIQNHGRLVNVDYKGGNRRFKTFSALEVLNGKLTRNDIEGKIVMMGFLGPGDEDKFISPLNRNGKEPDMYGLEYLAHIVAQVLESK